MKEYCGPFDAHGPCQVSSVVICSIIYGLIGWLRYAVLSDYCDDDKTHRKNVSLSVIWPIILIILIIKLV